MYLEIDMQIIWDKEAVENLKKSHTVLELETFNIKGKPITTYCVVPLEKVISEIAQLDNIKTLHSGFIQAYQNKDYKLCRDVSEHLLGKFGGELDSFYQEILSRIDK
jgi:hypothetical protein